MDIGAPGTSCGIWRGGTTEYAGLLGGGGGGGTAIATSCVVVSDFAGAGPAVLGGVAAAVRFVVVAVETGEVVRPDDVGCEVATDPVADVDGAPVTAPVAAPAVVLVFAGAAVAALLDGVGGVAAGVAGEATFVAAVAALALSTG